MSERRRFCFFLSFVILGGALAGMAAFANPVLAEPEKPAQAKNKPLELAVFEKLLAKHQDMTFDQLSARLVRDGKVLDALSFDPTRAAYFDRVSQKLGLTKEELEVFKRNGFVSIEMKRRYSFGSAYYEIYAKDLPVLVTTDSLLHAMHQSYDDILMEMEETQFTWTINEVLADCHKALAERVAENKDPGLAANFRDVDLYLTVARNLLAGAGAPAQDPSGDAWAGDLLAPSRLQMDKEALARLKDIQSLKLQTPGHPPPTEIYGGQRYMDYSQFKPRGHYTKSTELKRYFRCLMWLGRIDCGWNVLPTEGTPGVVSDSDRELRDAVLLVELLQATDSLKSLRSLDDILAFMIGRSDNLTVFALRDLMKQNKVQTLTDVRGAEALGRLKTALQQGKQGQQMIRSQVVISDPNDPYYKVPPPSTFQLFGQRFIIDSFVLSQVVFDSIVFKNKKQERMMPSGLDVMAALGNNQAIPLLADDLRKWNYSSNLMSCREFVDLHKPEFWKANLYNLWLDSLRTLHEDMTEHKYFPEAMRTKAWQMKQLQTQLGSWAELRHDTILYAKQSYTAYPECEYPAGYVEPYPEFYGRLKFFAEEAGRLFRTAEYTSKDAGRAQQLQQMKKHQEEYFQKMAETMGALQTLAQKELKAAPFTEKEKTFLKKTIDRRGGGSGPPRYDGWYAGLFYKIIKCQDWNPVVADVHTDPESSTCLEVGVGDVNLGVIAIDNGPDRAVYVGPLYSYYEFRQPVADRLTDEQWQQKIATGKTPSRPSWVEAFQAPARKQREP
jgi:Protein of unknown function (DUF3160)